MSERERLWDAIMACAMDLERLSVPSHGSAAAVEASMDRLAAAVRDAERARLRDALRRMRDSGRTEPGYLTAVGEMFDALAALEGDEA